jgi:hypothetical protein
MPNIWEKRATTPFDWLHAIGYALWRKAVLFNEMNKRRFTRSLYVWFYNAHGEKGFLSAA